MKIVAEIGINHNGDLGIALDMIRAAKAAGADAVKFQKRDPERCVPADQRDVQRDTPWGRMSYIEYRHRMEFGTREYSKIDEVCNELGIDWSASVWDYSSVLFMERYRRRWLKVPSAKITDHKLVNAVFETGAGVVLSTGMSTPAEIAAAVDVAGRHCTILHCVSAYPCPVDKLNLMRMKTLMNTYPDCAVGYSGHEVGLATTVAAAAMGAKFIERHFTLDRSMWGSDQAASVEPQGMAKLVRDIRAVVSAMGTRELGVDDIERPSLAKLRG